MYKELLIICEIHIPCCNCSWMWTTGPTVVPFPPPPLPKTHTKINYCYLLGKQRQSHIHGRCTQTYTYHQTCTQKQLSSLERQNYSHLQTCLPSAFTSAREETGMKQNRNDAGTWVGTSFLLKGQQNQAKRDRHKVSQVCMRLTYLCMEKKSPREKSPSQRSKIKQ